MSTVNTKRCEALLSLQRLSHNIEFQIEELYNQFRNVDNDIKEISMSLNEMLAAEVLSANPEAGSE